MAAGQLVIRQAKSLPAPVLSTRQAGGYADALAASALRRVTSITSRRARHADGVSADRERRGAIAGQVADAESGEPIAGVVVSLEGTDIGVVSGRNGNFAIPNVPAGRYTVIAERIGFEETHAQDVSVVAGGTTAVNLSMEQAVLALQEIVATGLVDPVEGVRSPISVARVDRETMPIVVSGNAVQNLQGRVAGMSINRQSGQPGEGVTMMLRTPTSVTGTGEPLIVVDGIILGGVIDGPETVDIEGANIESIEVVRGAAAASLYGSRAAAGVISITTDRGQGLELGQTRFSARSELGIIQAPKGTALPVHHMYFVDEAGTTYVDANGDPVDRSSRVTESSPARQFMDKPYPDQTYDNVSAVLQPGTFQSHNVSMAQNAEDTNFAVSLGRLVEEGALANNDGYSRNSIQLNLDHRFVDRLSFGLTMYHSRDYRDNIAGAAATLFQNVLQAPRDVDLRRKGESGQYLQQPDSDVGYENPLWFQGSRENERRSIRTLGSARLRWEPAPWITAGGLLSYDRGDMRTRDYVPKGTPLSVGQEGVTDGSIAFSTSLSDTWNAEAEISLRRDFGRLYARTTGRAIVERDRSETGFASGENFILADVPHIDNTAPENRDASSTERDVRALGYLWDTAFDYDGKYIFTVLLRRDGSSLFGADNRWHTYYRTAAAYRLSQEDWFNVRHVDELKLSYARGTAGGRPIWAAQYETWKITQGIPTKDALGNRRLRPEHTLEQELSLDLILFGRLGIELTHAWQRTTDQLYQLPQAAFTGYSTQWVNGGSVTGRSTELSIQGQLVQGQNFGWNSMIVADRSNGEIEEWPFPCDATNNWRLYCSGAPIYGLYGLKLLTDRSELAQHRGGDALDYAHEFDVNDDGYLVWVGEGNTYRDGLAKGLWGTSTTIGGRTYEWGMPFFEQDEFDVDVRQLIGDGAHYNIGWINDFRIGNISLHTHFHAALGGDANNRTYQELVSTNDAPEMDQSGKPDGLKKPVRYYTSLAGAGGSTHFVESGNYLKLRTVSLSYRLSTAQLAQFGLARLGVRSLRVGLIGRNLFTLSPYTGFDPEQALNFSDRTNQDRFQYPITRNFTAEVSVAF